MQSDYIYRGFLHTSIVTYISNNTTTLLASLLKHRLLVFYGIVSSKYWSYKFRFEFKNLNYSCAKVLICIWIFCSIVIISRWFVWNGLFIVFSFAGNQLFWKQLAIHSIQYHNIMSTRCTEAATGGVLYKRVFLKISQNSQENTCATISFLIKLQIWGL